MNIFDHLSAVRLNDTELRPGEDYQIRAGKLWIDGGVRKGDSVLLISADDAKWASRRIFVGPGGNADLYVHPDTLNPPQRTAKRVIPTAASAPPDLVEAIKGLGLDANMEEAVLSIEAEVRAGYEQTIKGLMMRIESARRALDAQDG